MKGVVFTELLDFVSTTHGADIADDIIDDAALPHGKAYTSVGTYPFQEMQRLITALCCRANSSGDTLLNAFGGHLCSRFVVKFAAANQRHRAPRGFPGSSRSERPHRRLT